MDVDATSTVASSAATSCSPNPVVAASGTFGHGDEVAPALRPPGWAR